MKFIPVYDALQKLRIARALPFLGLLLIAPLGACAPDEPQVEASTPPVEPISSCSENSALDTSVYGVIETTIAWSGSDMICENMKRPDGQGIRFRFAGDIEGERLALIIALPELRAGQQGIETPANVTAMVEGSGRFFTTPGLDSCWAEIGSQESVGDGVVALSGELSCIAPLGEVNGDANVTIPTLSFATSVDWSE